jgi:hypothetical protein
LEAGNPSHGESLHSTKALHAACLPCLTHCCLQVLEPPHGEVLVAAKSYYFGVGGSTDSFRKAVTADGVMECTQVRDAVL